MEVITDIAKQRLTFSFNNTIKKIISKWLIPLIKNVGFGENASYSVDHLSNAYLLSIRYKCH
ncbi:hypothetical protein GCM10016272_05260 [Psychrobacter glaciei]|uniref:Uncharacterized protein n=1 Tax=Psychrobacter glaciei TaxID=619771 RepID=A0ABQ3GP66_9GAMM|nr:hypothetical protein GCM10016272_05260 [Psychrobacter glaciei]